MKDPEAPKPGANFESSSRVTEALHPGNIAARTSERLFWDSASATLDGSLAALARLEYRKGWSL